MIQIRRAVYEDIPRIMRFIDEHWKKGHILARDREFFEWQYVDDGLVNVIIAIDDTGNVYGVKTYIPYNSYEVCDVAGSLWKTIKSEELLLGIKLCDEFDRVNIHNFCGASGLNKKAVKYTNIIGQFADQLRHYYRLNDCDNYTLAVVSEKIIPKCVKIDNMKLKRICDFGEFKKIVTKDTLDAHIPVKDYHYLEKRYFQHPVFEYKAYAIRLGELCRTAIIAREVEYNNAKVLRIVDFIGYDEDLIGIGNELDGIMRENSYEFVDFYEYGISDSIMEKAGFVLRNDDRNILPNYFQPFEQKNIDLYFSASHHEKFHLYRGDGDQDRPS